MEACCCKSAVPVVAAARAAADPPSCRPRTAGFPNPPPPLPQVLLVAYPFLWFKLYSFLMRQRAKKLGPAAAGDKKRQ